MNQQQIIDRFKELVTIDSLSKEEGEIASYLEAELKKLGLKVERDDTGKKIGGETGNLIARLEGNVEEAPTLLLSAHLDTVGPGQGIEPVIEDGKLVSKGDTILGADDKAGIVAILEALRYIKTNQLEHGDLEVVFTVGEEVGLLGSKNLDCDQLEAEMGVVYDSSGPIGKIVTQAPAQDKIKVKVEGKSAHAGINPSGGVNAIKVASIAISNLNLGRIDEETTANIGVVRGGQATNVVPDLVELEGEARSHQERKLEKQINHMTSIFKQAARKFNAQVEFDITRKYPSFELGRNERIVDVAIKAARNIGLKSNLQATGGGSDANIFNQQGISTVNLGIGMEEVHSPEENIAVTSLVNSVKYSISLLRQVV